jgi:hypothetical protein
MSQASSQNKLLACIVDDVPRSAIVPKRQERSQEPGPNGKEALPFHSGQ